MAEMSIVADEESPRTERVAWSGALYEHLCVQGLTTNQIDELLERKRKNPALQGCTVGGRWISLALRTKADTARFNDMMASGTPPMSNTDREFLHGRWEDEDMVTRHYRQQAEAAGIDTAGAIYLSGIARYPGDHEAFIRDRGDVQKRIESRPGWICEGSVKARGPTVDSEPESVGVADDIVAERVAKRVRKNPDLARRPVAELQAEEKAAATPHWKKKK